MFDVLQGALSSRNLVGQGYSHHFTAMVILKLGTSRALFNTFVELILLYILACRDFILNFRACGLLHYIFCVHIKHGCYFIQYSLVVISNEAAAAVAYDR
jgi:hypothetical protein